MREIGHFIGGRVIAGRNGRFANVFNPATGAVQAHVALASKTKTVTVRWPSSIKNGGAFIIPTMR